MLEDIKDPEKEESKPGGAGKNTHEPFRNTSDDTKTDSKESPAEPSTRQGEERARAPDSHPQKAKARLCLFCYQAMDVLSSPHLDVAAANELPLSPVGPGMEGSIINPSCAAEWEASGRHQNGAGIMAASFVRTRVACQSTR